MPRVGWAIHSAALHGAVIATASVRPRWLAASALPHRPGAVSIAQLLHLPPWLLLNRRTLSAKWALRSGTEGSWSARGGGGRVGGCPTVRSTRHASPRHAACLRKRLAAARARGSATLDRQELIGILFLQPEPGDHCHQVGSVRVPLIVTPPEPCGACLGAIRAKAVGAQSGATAGARSSNRPCHAWGGRSTRRLYTVP